MKENKLFIEGYIYYKSKTHNGKVYWDCIRTKTKECTGRAITSAPQPGQEEVTLYKGPAESAHLHAPNRDEVDATVLTQTLKRKAAEHPGQPPAQILREELAGVSSGVLSQLPVREALSKAMRRERRKNLPPNPRSLAELGRVPTMYAKTLLGEQFLLYDSLADEEEDEDEDYSDSDSEERDERDRVLVFATARNIEVLCKSRIWFVDGTFKTSPGIFTQVFTVMGLCQRSASNENVALPLLYAFLSRKTEEQYTTVLRALRNAVTKYRVQGPCLPDRIMSDFEKGLINACNNVFPEAQVSGCFFHLGQSVYRRLQEEGLQAQYNDEDRRLKRYTHMLLSLAFVPVDDVSDTLTMLKAEWRDEDDFIPMMKYFEKVYVSGVPGRGRRRAVAVRYPPALWNQYVAATTKDHRTNNVSESWHNRFQVVVGKHHPDIYSALKELQREQGDTEIMIAELSLGRRVKAMPRKKWIDMQQRIQDISLEYETYKDADDVLGYLRTLSYNFNL